MKSYIKVAFESIFTGIELLKMKNLCLVYLLKPKARHYWLANGVLAIASEQRWHAVITLGPCPLIVHTPSCPAMPGRLHHRSQFTLKVNTQPTNDFEVESSPLWRLGCSVASPICQLLV